MALLKPQKHLVGYKWRSSRFLIIACIAIALFTENFMFSFIVPILDSMLENRLNVDRSDAQYIISVVLSMHALVGVVVGPITGHIADKLSSRKGGLLVSLTLELIGVVVVAISTSVPILITGRVILALGGNAAWIIGLATIADTVGADNAAKTLGTISVIYMSGLLVGPMVSGWMLRLFGYWPTWSVAILVLVVDMALRLVMVENPAKQKSKEDESDTYTNVSSLMDDSPEGVSRYVDANIGSSDSSDETTPLLESSTQDSEQYDVQVQDGNGLENQVVSMKGELPNFYLVLLTHPRALTAMACHMMSALVVTSLDTTLPLHVIQEFNWNTAQISLMFFLVQIPQLFLLTFTGWLKDKHGTKILTGVGFSLTGLLLWLLGVPGTGKMEMGSGNQREALYSSTLLALGFARSLTVGTGVLEMTSVVRDVQTAKPGIFGPNGGYSRAYSLTNMSWNTGLLVGPMMSGFLVDTAGYYYMNFTFAVISFVVGIACFVFLHKK